MKAFIQKIHLFLSLVWRINYDGNRLTARHAWEIAFGPNNAIYALLGKNVIKYYRPVKTTIYTPTRTRYAKMSLFTLGFGVGVIVARLLM